LEDYQLKKNYTLISCLLVILIFTTSEANGARLFFNVPRVTVGGSAGFFRISLDKFTNNYDSRWGNIFSGQVSIRVYKTNYISLQYARFQKTAVLKDDNRSGTASWDERFINLGIRWYADTTKPFRFYSGFGFTFINIKEKARFSVLKPGNPNDVITDGNGFYLEIGGDYLLLPHVALNLELEISSAGEGGNPGFMASSLGGYTLLAGINIHI